MLRVHVNLVHIHPLATPPRLPCIIDCIVIQAVPQAYQESTNAEMWNGIQNRINVQWDPSIADTIGNQHCVPYNEVSLTQGLAVHFR